MRQGFAKDRYPSYVGTPTPPPQPPSAFSQAMQRLADAVSLSHVTVAIVALGVGVAAGLGFAVVSQPTLREMTAERDRIASDLVKAEARIADQQSWAEFRVEAARRERNQAVEKQAELFTVFQNLTDRIIDLEDEETKLREELAKRPMTRRRP